jgi:hypothetical protein
MLYAAPSGDGAMSGAYFENLAREEKLQPGSERSFGLVMAAAFVALAGLTLWRGSIGTSLLWLAGAAALAALALAAPRLLRPLNAAWFRFGLLLHRLLSPLVLAVLFFGVITPMGLLMRLFGQRPLVLGHDQAAASYWIPRAGAKSAPGSMRKQY